ncbi:MAG: SDR family oxidoreductase [Acidobacteria bacterium]|nr:SDR family oxidoreductase [Acidobacteriota bacterium]
MSQLGNGGGSLAGSVVVVTGATRGIGKAAAVALGRRGANVVIVGRSTADAPNRGGLPGTLESVGEELAGLGVDVLAVPADLSKGEDIERVVSATNDRFGRCDVLVNNAAISFLGDFLDVPPRRWQPVFAVNLLAPVTLIHAFLPGMIERGEGRIVNMTSGSADTSDPGGVRQLPYSATKAGMDAMSIGLAHQVAGTGVAVNLLAPSVLTEAVTFSIPDQVEELAKRMARPERYGEALAWVVEQPTSFTGQYLTNDDLAGLGALVA